MARAIPDPIKDKLVVKSDASNEAMGAVLYMCDDTSLLSDHQHTFKCLKPVEFFSKCLSESQRNKLHAREKELLSFKHCCPETSDNPLTYSPPSHEHASLDTRERADALFGPVSSDSIVFERPTRSSSPKVLSDDDIIMTEPVHQLSYPI